MSYLALKEQDNPPITAHGTGERGKFRYRSDGKIEKVPPKEIKKIHGVIQDTIEPKISDVDGETVFDSRSQYLRHCRERGFEPVKGFGKPEFPEKMSRDARRAEIAATLNKNSWGMIPRDEKQRHENLCGSEELRREEAWCKRNGYKFSPNK